MAGTAGKAGITAQTEEFSKRLISDIRRSALGGHGGRPAAGGYCIRVGYMGGFALAVRDGGPALDRTWPLSAHSI